MDDPNRRLDHEYGKRSKERIAEIEREFDSKKAKKQAKLEKHLRNEEWKAKYAPKTIQSNIYLTNFFSFVCFLFRREKEEAKANQESASKQ